MVTVNGRSTTTRRYAREQVGRRLNMVTSLANLQKSIDFSHKLAAEVKSLGYVPKTREELLEIYESIGFQLERAHAAQAPYKSVSTPPADIIKLQEKMKQLAEAQVQIEAIMEIGGQIESGVIRDLNAHFRRAVKSRIYDVRKNFGKPLREAFARDDVGGIILRNTVGQWKGNNIASRAARKLFGLDYTIAAPKGIGNGSKPSRRAANTNLGFIPPVDPLGAGLSTATSTVNAAAQATNTQTMRNNARTDRRETNEYREGLFERLDSLIKVLQEFVGGKNGSFKRNANDNGGGLVETAVAGLGLAAMAKWIGKRTGLTKLFPSLGAALGLGAKVAPVAAGGAALAAAKSPSMLGRAGRFLGRVATPLATGFSIADNFNRGSRGENFLGDGSVTGALLDSRASNYGAAATGGFMLGGPVGAGVGLLGAYTSDNWDTIQNGQNNSMMAQADAFGVFDDERNKKWQEEVAKILRESSKSLLNIKAESKEMTELQRLQLQQQQMLMMGMVRSLVTGEPFNPNVISGGAPPVVGSGAFSSGKAVGGLNLGSSSGSVVEGRVLNGPGAAYNVPVSNGPAQLSVPNGEGWVEPIPGAKTGSGFGKRKPPKTKGGRHGSSMHKGQDYPMPEGTPIQAAQSGTIIKIGPGGGYGNRILIQGDNGYDTLYGHMARFSDGLATGTKVSAGQTIGYVGSTGNSSGPHLHFEIHKNGKPINPANVDLKGGGSPAVGAGTSAPMGPQSTSELAGSETSSPFAGAVSSPMATSDQQSPFSGASNSPLATSGASFDGYVPDPSFGAPSPITDTGLASGNTPQGQPAPAANKVGASGNGKGAPSMASAGVDIDSIPLMESNFLWLVSTGAATR